MGSDVEIVLRQSVVQMEHTNENTLRMFSFIYTFFTQYFQYSVGKLFVCFLKQCFDPERIFFLKMFLIVTSQGKNPDTASDSSSSKT